MTDLEEVALRDRSIGATAIIYFLEDFLMASPRDSHSTAGLLGLCILLREQVEKWKVE